MSRTRLFTSVHALALSVLVWLTLVSSSPIFACSLGGGAGGSSCGGA